MTDWDPRALAVLERLEGAGFRAVLVGGCVRDSLLGLAPHDYDAATSALPEQVEAACSGLRCVETGLRHGTVTVLSGGLPIEVTTFRREGGYSDHRRPDPVEFTPSLEEDLARRDFTVNAMAWGLDGSSPTPSAAGPTWSRSWCAVWGSPAAASGRTPCGSSGGCGWPPSWAFPSTRTLPPP